MDVEIGLMGDNLITYYFEELDRDSILLLPGLPSLPCKKEVAKIISSIGYNTILFHYKGTWGSKGFFSPDPEKEIKHFIENVEKGFKGVFSGKAMRIKKPRIAIGFSYGGFVALLSSDLFEKVISFAPPLSLKGEEKVIDSLKLAGEAYRINEKSLKIMEKELKEENFRNSLVIHGINDSIVPFDKNKEFYERKGVNYYAIEADHYPSSLLLELSIEKIRNFI